MAWIKVREYSGGEEVFVNTRNILKVSGTMGHQPRTDLHYPGGNVQTVDGKKEDIMNSILAAESLGHEL